MTEYLNKKCVALDSKTTPKTKEEIDGVLEALEGWRFTDGVIKKTFKFSNYYETTAFVNAVVWIAHKEDHHPDISFGYKSCTVVYSTHSVGGVSENDFICAAKINAIAAF